MLLVHILTNINIVHTICVQVGWESTQKYYSYEYTSSEYKGLDPVDQQVVFKGKWPTV